MFDPKMQDVRRFFCGVWRKHLDKLPLEPLEAMALDWILEHPEYQKSLDDPEKAIAADYSPQAGRTNPFLHLSLHLAISEQLSIYRRSILTMSSKDVLLRPSTCHSPVIPGFASSIRLRCQD